MQLRSPSPGTGEGENNDFLTDAVTFFWVFGDDEVVIGDHDGAGFEREASDEDHDDEDEDDSDD